MTCAAIAEVDHIALQGELLLADAFQANSSDSKVEQRAKVISFTTPRVRIKFVSAASRCHSCRSLVLCSATIYPFDQ
jgi:hypothetical protein